MPKGRRLRRNLLISVLKLLNCAPDSELREPLLLLLQSRDEQRLAQCVLTAIRDLGLRVVTNFLLDL